MVDFGFALYAFTMLFLIVDPIANVPIFQAILAGKKEGDRKRIIREAVFVAGLVLFILSFAGKAVFSLMGVQMYAFRIAGGILLFLVSIEMLYGQKSKTEHSHDDKEVAKEMDDVVVTPLAIPLLTGPGAITTGIVLFDSASSVEQKTVVLVCLPLVFVASWLILEFGQGFFERIGPIASKVFTRVMGLMLAGIAVQFIFVGVQEGAKALGFLA